MRKALLLSLLSITTLLVSITSCNNNNSDTSNSNNENSSTNNETSSSIESIDGDVYEVKSPDNSIIARLTLEDDGSLSYNVKKNDVVVVDDSSLGYLFKEANLYEMLAFESIEKNAINVTYTNKSGRHSTVNASCNEIKVKFKEYNYYLTVTMRAYDDGYAFKYDIDAVDNSTGKIHIEDELSEFTLPTDSTTWIMPYVSNKASTGEFFSYEETYQRKKATNLYGKKISMPMIYQAGKSDVYSLITESQLIGSGFYGSFLEAKEDGSTTLQTIHSPATIAKDDSELNYPFSSPWRVGITGSLKDITESELVEKLYDDCEYYKPENYDQLSKEEQEIYNYDWVEAGVTAWNWLIYTGKKPQDDFDLQKEYVDLAYDMGWKYTILDGGWNANFNANTFKNFMKYATDKGIKVLVWCNALTDFANGSLSLLKSKLDTWASYGVAGIKIDFFDGQNATGQTHQGEDKETIKWYESIYQECAKRKMVVNCHGSNKPTGERRVYPNVINREGVRGNEFHSIDATAIVNSMFTRMIIGPADFTPVVNPLSKSMTIGSQMATTVLYESGAPSMADYSQTYSREDINEYYKSLPALWDDMEYLGGIMDEYFMAARKSNENWYVAAINSLNERTVDVDFSFLDKNATYKATIYEDGATYKKLEVSTKIVTSEDMESLNLVKNGGFVIHLEKQ